jgi:para-nitrobenzyl esterase
VRGSPNCSGVRATREALARVPVDRLLEAQALIDAEVLKCPDPARWGSEVVASTMPFHPVVDGDVLPAPPIDRIGAGAASDVDVLIGTNADDWRFAPVLGGFIDQVTQEALAGPTEVYGSWSIAAFGLPVDAALAHYRARHPDAIPGDLLAAVLTDWWVRLPALRLADAHAPGGAPPHVRVRLALARPGRASRRVSRAGDPVRLRHPRPRPQADARRGPRPEPSPTPGRHDASRLDRVRSPR